jgi:hypothetical protein
MPRNFNEGAGESGSSKSPKPPRASEREEVSLINYTYTINSSIINKLKIIKMINFHYAFDISRRFSGAWCGAGLEEQWPCLGQQSESERQGGDEHCFVIRSRLCFEFKQMAERGEFFVFNAILTAKTRGKN